jgi:hypothetical protein
MVKQRRRSVLLGLAALGLLAVLLVTRLTGGGAASGAVARRPGPADARQAAAGDVPRIGLERLGLPAGGRAAGKRDIFDFGPPPTVAPTPTPPPTLPVATAPPSTVPAGPPPPPPLNVKFVGTVEDKKGLQVAILMTDAKEILTGQAGQTVANRLKIVSIGRESVDVQDIGSDRIRRIPLKGN